MNGDKTQPPTEPNRNSENMLRIAVIDDEQSWLKVIKRMFRNSAYVIETYEDPQEFLRLIAVQPHRYAGIICDIKMPQLDGCLGIKPINQR